LSVTLESQDLKFEISKNGSYKVIDKQTNMIWRSNPYIPRFGSATIRTEGRIHYLSLDNLEISKIDGEIRLICKEQKDGLSFHVKLLDDGRTLEFSYDASENVEVENIRLLDDGLWLTDVDEGYIIVPVREGLLIPSNSGRAFIRMFETFAYEGCHMEMLGIVKRKSAVLITWHDPYVTAEVRSTLNSAAAQARQILSVSLDLKKTARAFRMRFLGEGDYVTIAKAY